MAIIESFAESRMCVLSVTTQALWKQWHRVVSGDVTVII